MLRSGWILLIACAACGKSLTNPLEQLAPAIPTAPRTQDDTLRALVLAEVLRQGTVDLEPRPAFVILQSDFSAQLTTSALPHSQMTKFYFLTRTEIQDIADKSGDLRYLKVAPAVVQADSAHVGVGTDFALQRKPGRSGYLEAGGGCRWPLVREPAGWRVLAPQYCRIR
jgi:hypothetical protein